MREGLQRLVFSLVVLAVGASAFGCAAAAEDSASQGSQGTIMPWVQGGQTGALMPACGLTTAAREGQSIPGGDAGIVIHTDACLGLAAAELELRDADGMPVDFTLEPLGDGAMLVRPRRPLDPGLYRLAIAGMTMQALVGEAPAELPMRLGSAEPAEPHCGAALDLAFDPSLLPYLAQLKLSVSVDGGPEAPWFDYGELELTDGRARLSLPSCGGSQCLSEGEHSLRVIAELAGELGTLEPLEVVVQTLCSEPAAVGRAQSGSGSPSACAVSRIAARPAAGGFGWLALCAAAWVFSRRRSGARRSKGSGRAS